MNEHYEKRHVKAEDAELRVETEGDGSRLIGYPIRFNVWSQELDSYFRERIRPEAVTEALMTSDIRMLYDHSTNHLPLGRSRQSKKDTLFFTTDTKGVKIENDLPDITLANEMRISIGRGDVDGMSFGFTVKNKYDDGVEGDEWSEKDGVVSRTITKFKEFFDFSVVVYPAYTQAKVSVRALERCKELRKSAATSGDNTGATARELELMGMNFFDFNMEARRF